MDKKNKGKQVEDGETSRSANEEVQPDGDDPYYDLAMEHVQRCIANTKWRNKIYEVAAENTHQSPEVIRYCQRLAKSYRVKNILDSRKPNAWTVQPTVAPCGHIAMSPDRCISCEMFAELSIAEKEEDEDKDAEKEEDEEDEDKDAEKEEDEDEEEEEEED